MKDLVFTVDIRPHSLKKYYNILSEYEAEAVETICTDRTRDLEKN